MLDEIRLLRLYSSLPGVKTPFRIMEVFPLTSLERDLLCLNREIWYFDARRGLVVIVCSSWNGGYDFDPRLGKSWMSNYLSLYLRDRRNHSYGVCKRYWFVLERLYLLWWYCERGLQRSVWLLRQDWNILKCTINLCVCRTILRSKLMQVLTWEFLINVIDYCVTRGKGKLWVWLV